MNKRFITLLKDIRQQRKLSAKRHPMYQNNKFGKYFMYLFALIWVGYLVLFGFLLPSLFREEMPGMEPYHVLNGGMWYIFMIDFCMRFMGQKLPASEVKPYAVLPVRKRDVLDCHLLLNGLDTYNLIWLCLLLPFGCMTLWKFFGLGGLLGFILGYLILIIANGYWHSICRTLMNEHILWVLLPIAVYGGIIALMATTKWPNHIGMEWGEGFIQWEPLAFLAAIAVLALLFWLCRVMQLKIVDKEIARTKTTKLKRVREYKFLDRFGEIGEYLRLEIKLLTRNKVPKVQFDDYVQRVFGLHRCVRRQLHALLHRHLQLQCTGCDGIIAVYDVRGELSRRPDEPQGKHPYATEGKVLSAVRHLPTAITCYDCSCNQG